MEYIPWITTLISAIGALLAWAAKILWSKEFADAKNEVIRAREAEIKTKEAFIDSLKNEIEMYRDLTPMKMQEYLHATKNGLETYIEKLKADLNFESEEIIKKDKMISELSNDKTISEDKINRLIEEKSELENKVKLLNNNLSIYSEAQDRMTIISGTVDQFNAQFPSNIWPVFSSEHTVFSTEETHNGFPITMNSHKENSVNIPVEVNIAKPDHNKDK